MSAAAFFGRQGSELWHRYSIFEVLEDYFHWHVATHISRVTLNDVSDQAQSGLLLKVDEGDDVRRLESGKNIVVDNYEGMNRTPSAYRRPAQLGRSAVPTEGARVMDICLAVVTSLDDEFVAGSRLPKGPSIGVRLGKGLHS
jgi:hypothetical protein